ncbi:MAG TPA: metal-dependent hydrolase [Defluviitoga sp.]|nr:metal-dependent hydrolase [Defluviitoga sp.]
MPNFKTHIFSGILVFPIFFFLFNWLYTLFFNEVNYISYEIVISYFLFVIGSDFPDVDHNYSFVNKLFRLSLIFGVVYYLFEYDYLYRNYLPLSYNLSNLIILSLGILIGLLLGFLFNALTKHRGIWHSIFMAIGMSVAIYLINIKSRKPVKILYCFSFLSGFSLHLFLDKFLDSSK